MKETSDIRQVHRGTVDASLALHTFGALAKDLGPEVGSLRSCPLRGHGQKFSLTPSFRLLDGWVDGQTDG